MQSNTLKIGIAYRPPSQNLENTICFANTVRDLLQNASNYVVLGDFNFTGIDWAQGLTSNSGESHFYNILNELNATQMVNEPTTQYDSLLDLCIGSNDTIASDVEVGEYFSTSDHSIITCNLNIPFVKHKEKPSLLKNF